METQRNQERLERLLVDNAVLQTDEHAVHGHTELQQVGGYPLIHPCFQQDGVGMGMTTALSAHLILGFRGHFQSIALREVVCSDVLHEAEVKELHDQPGQHGKEEGVGVVVGVELPRHARAGEGLGRRLQHVDERAGEYYTNTHAFPQANYIWANIKKFVVLRENRYAGADDGGYEDDEDGRDVQSLVVDYHQRSGTWVYVATASDVRVIEDEVGGVEEDVGGTEVVE